jgi:hypothetical protein
MLLAVSVAFALALAPQKTLDMVKPHVSPSAPSWQCHARPIAPCFTAHGRLSSQNGAPLKIWLIGTNRVVRVENGFDNIPSAMQKYLEMTSPDHSYIYGDFEICPLEPDTPGHMRSACVTSATKLVVRNLRQSQPAFRLPSTWPSARSAR